MRELLFSSLGEQANRAMHTTLVRTAQGNLQDQSRRRYAEARRQAHALLDMALQPGPMLEIRLA
jgi:hypothetical protein